jgi:deoxyadenosine/deoxycytidine kinase
LIARNNIIGIVGPCAAGKTTLTSSLKALGFNVRHIAQEHSYVPNMWERITNPQLLIFLEVSYPVTLQRKKLDWTLKEFEEQLRRLENARQNADLVIETDLYSPGEILEIVLNLIKEKGLFT